VHKMGMMTEETIAHPIVVDQPSQDECQGITHRVSLANELAKINFEFLNLALVRDEFDVDMFDENLDNEQHVEKNDETTSSIATETYWKISIDTRFFPYFKVNKLSTKEQPISPKVYNSHSHLF
jgi:hypothetical protein